MGDDHRIVAVKLYKLDAPLCAYSLYALKEDKDKRSCHACSFCCSDSTCRFRVGHCRRPLDRPGSRNHAFSVNLVGPSFGILFDLPFLCDGGCVGRNCMGNGNGQCESRLSRKRGGVYSGVTVGAGADSTRVDPPPTSSATLFDAHSRAHSFRHATSSSSRTESSLLSMRSARSRSLAKLRPKVGTPKNQAMTAIHPIPTSKVQSSKGI